MEKQTTPIGQDVRTHYDAKAGRILKKAIGKLRGILHPGFHAAVIVVTPDGHISLASNMKDDQVRSTISALRKELDEGGELKRAQTVIDNLTQKEPL
jgi:hypothetical protein